MTDVISPRQLAEATGLPHQEVIRRIRRGDIRAEKMGWNWVLDRKEIQRVKESSWYNNRLARLAAQERLANA